MPDSYLEFRYLYRDASNYKVHGSLILRGRVTGGELASLTQRLEEGCFFVAEQVGIPPLYARLTKLSGGVTPDDHAWHSFEAMEVVNRRAPLAVWGTVDELLKKFASVKTWRINLSAIYS
jgi:hypothetical protein